MGVGGTHKNGVVVESGARSNPRPDLFRDGEGHSNEVAADEENGPPLLFESDGPSPESVPDPDRMTTQKGSESAEFHADTRRDVGPSETGFHRRILFWWHSHAF